MIRRVILGVSILGMLSACAHDSTLMAIENAKERCATEATRVACSQIGMLEDMARRERSEVAGNIALGILGAVLVVGAVALAGAPPPGLDGPGPRGFGGPPMPPPPPRPPRPPR